MKKEYIVSLSVEQQNQLHQMISSGTAASRVHTRARILLLADQSDTGLAKTDDEIHSSLGSSISTIARIRKRFVEHGLDGALYDKKSSRIYKRSLDGDQEAHLIAIACSSAPEGHARWSVTLLADKLVELNIIDSIHPTTIWRTLKKTKLNPG